MNERVCVCCGRPAVGERMEYVGGTGYVPTPTCGDSDVVCAAYQALRLGYRPVDERVSTVLLLLKARAA